MTGWYNFDGESLDPPRGGGGDGACGFADKVGRSWRWRAADCDDSADVVCEVSESKISSSFVQSHPRN